MTVINFLLMFYENILFFPLVFKKINFDFNQINYIFIITSRDALKSRGPPVGHSSVDHPY